MKVQDTEIEYTQKLNKVISKLIRFLDQNDFKGWEPYDVLNNRLKSFFKAPIFRVLITQVFRLSPIFIHPLLKEKRLYAKAVALFAHSFLILYEITKSRKYRDRAIYFLDWLDEHRSLQSRNFSLGSQYDLNLKTYESSSDTPSPFITALAVEAFISAYKILGQKRYLEIAESGIRYFLDELPQIQVKNDQSYFIYHPNNSRFIPNLPAIISGTLARFYSISGDITILNTVVKNLKYVVQWQRSNGSWFYNPNTKYVDNFHTGFILEALAKFEYYTKDIQFKSAFSKGLSYYIKNLFKSNGIPIHIKLSGIPQNADSLFTKIDLRDFAQTIILFNFLNEKKLHYIRQHYDLFNWSSCYFKSKKGYFYYQQLPIYIIKGPFITMQAWMLYALVKMLKQFR